MLTGEIIEQLGADAGAVTHMFMPVGVGGLAAAMAYPFWQLQDERLCRLVTVESLFSACFLTSIARGEATLVDVEEETLMAGLSCGEPSSLAWSMLREVLSDCVAITDDAVVPLMRYLHGLGIEAGECATSGLAALLQLHAHASPEFLAQFGLDADSVVVLIGCEGATDAAFYDRVVKGQEE